MDRQEILKQLKEKRALKTEYNSEDIAKIQKIYSSLENNFKSNGLSLSEEFVNLFIKTKRREEYYAFFYIYKIIGDEKELLNVGITKNIIEYCNKYIKNMKVNFDKTKFKIEFVFIGEKETQESLDSFLKRVEKNVKENKPKEFSQDLGENFYIIKYKSPELTSTKIRKAKTKSDGKKLKDTKNISDISNKNVVKFVKLSKSLNGKDEKEINDQDLLEIRTDGIMEDDYSSKDEEMLEENASDIEETGDKFLDIFNSVMDNRSKVIYVVKSEKEIYEWEEQKRIKNLSFYRKIGGSSY